MTEELTEEEKQTMINTYNKLKESKPGIEKLLTEEDLLESSRIDKFYNKTQLENGIEFTHIATGKSFKIYKKDYEDMQLPEISPYVNEKVRKFEYVEL